MMAHISAYRILVERYSMSDGDRLNEPRLLRRLVDISLTLNSTLESEELLRSILGIAAEILDCETASILLHNEKRGDLTFISATGSEADRLAEIPVPLEGSLAGLIFRSGEPLIINDVAADPRHFARVSQVTQFQPRSLLGVPMRRRDRTTGVLEALNKRHGEFDAADAQRLSVVASQAAVAIHNAQLVQDLRRAHAELSRVDEVKSRFMALASHELRTPLAIITNYAEFLRQDAPGPLSAHAERVLQAALRQRDIIDSMTNMNLLQLGTLDVRLSPMSLGRLVDAVSSEQLRHAEAKQLRVHMALPPEPVLVNADAERLPLAIANVLNNAIRFTPRGGLIEVTMPVTAAEAHLVIRDTGAGIPPGELTNIFKDFYQVQDHMTRRHGGLGLGLAIARGIVRLHGGRIWAESPGHDQGTAVHIVLPRVHGA
jgi:signal transduction histidine kinase